MTLYVAFLRGINLGKRQMKMAELRDCLEAEGYGEVKTILASGNVRFATEGKEDEIASSLETIMEKRFGFEVGVVLRTVEFLSQLVASDPFARLDPNADATRHVLFSAQDLPEGLNLIDRPGHTEIVGMGPREIFIAGYRQPNGRYTEGVEEVLKPLYKRVGKGHLDTMRNWNTIEKVIP